MALYLYASLKPLHRVGEKRLRTKMGKDLSARTIVVLTSQGSQQELTVNSGAARNLDANVRGPKKDAKIRNRSASFARKRDNRRNSNADAKNQLPVTRRRNSRPAWQYSGGCF